MLPRAVSTDVVRLALEVLSGDGAARLVELGGGFEVWLERYVPGRLDEVAATSDRATTSAVTPLMPARSRSISTPTVG